MEKGKVSLRLAPCAAFCSLLAAFCLLSACATTADLDLLRQDVNRLQRDSLAARNEMDSLKEKTEGVAKEESFNVLRMNQADMQSRLTNIAKEVQVLSGRFDENKYSLEKTQKERAAELDLLKAQVAALEGQVNKLRETMAIREGESRERTSPQVNEAQGGSEAPRKEGLSGEEKASKPSASSDRLGKYESAYSAFKNKRYKESREKFEAFVKEFPSDELTDNAYFWIAETYYSEGDYEGAILSYETFLKKYPKSQKAPGAFLKQGLAFAAIGDGKTGKVILEQLIERYPDSNEAELAKKRIKEIDKKSAKKKK